MTDDLFRLFLLICMVVLCLPIPCAEGKLTLYEPLVLECLG